MPDLLIICTSCMFYWKSISDSPELLSRQEKCEYVQSHCLFAFSFSAILHRSKSTMDQHVLLNFTNFFFSLGNYLQNKYPSNPTGKILVKLTNGLSFLFKYIFTFESIITTLSLFSVQTISFILPLMIFKFTAGLLSFKCCFICIMYMLYVFYM